MSSTIKIRSHASYAQESARDLWYRRLIEFDGRPLDDFVASVEANPPSTPVTGNLAGQLEPVSGWLRFFEKEGVLEMLSSGEPTSVQFRLPDIEEEIRLSPDDILSALNAIDAGTDHNFAEARGYELRHGGNTYWPKADIR